jgi:carbon-monoxide dehydrogenase medium subunit
VSYFTTAVEADELLTEVRFPALPAGSGTCMTEVARRHGDFAMVGVAASLRDDGGTIADARIALIGVADTPLRAHAAEQALAGAAPGTETFAAAADAALADVTPPSDVHGSSAYRKHVAAVLVRRALESAWKRARSPA